MTEDKTTLISSLTTLLQNRDSVSVQSGAELKKKILALTDNKGLLCGILIDRLIEFDNELSNMNKFFHKWKQLQKHKTP